MHARRRSRALLAAAAVLALTTPAGCSRQTVEERARATAEKIQRSMVDVEAIALEQKVDPAVVAEVQRHLTAINEYQGETNGTLDSVTINAIQTFQRTAGLKDDGIIDARTRKALAEAAAGRTS